MHIKEYFVVLISIYNDKPHRNTSSDVYTQRIESYLFKKQMLKVVLETVQNNFRQNLCENITFAGEI